MSPAQNRTPRYWKSSQDRVICTLCPHGCRIAPGTRGVCGVRQNTDGRMTLPFYGHLSAVNIDPIEKKPLYHFLPGSRAFSIGFLGCNFHCPFCQNYEISQSTVRATRFMEPEEAVRSARAAGCASIAYTYNEPGIHFEYVADTARAARLAGMKNVLVSNGHLNAGPATELLDLMDAANVDLKSWSAGFYRDEVGGSLDAVKTFLKLAATACHLEVTTLLIPGINNSSQEIANIAAFVAGLGADIPLHLSAYYPTYKYTIPATSPSAVRTAVGVARKSLAYVYSGNTPEPNATVCLTCGSTLVKRTGYTVDRSGLRGGKCVACGTTTCIVDA
ncbi:MAG: AmmeMemoRadiSam system radical SAM enzyme [Spirochaetales bacterium]|nr:MAG: AmmeMemoRadiSam system radical SAM enzyme [Spirochaetales bacterium]